MQSTLSYHNRVFVIAEEEYMEQRWRARWLEDGKEREYLFYSVKNRLVARIDFRLKLAEASTACPEVYELEEASYGLDSLESSAEGCGQADSLLFHQLL